MDKAQIEQSLQQMWSQTPTDDVAERITAMARQYGVRTPWEIQQGSGQMPKMQQPGMLAAMPQQQPYAAPQVGNMPSVPFGYSIPQDYPQSRR